MFYVNDKLEPEATSVWEDGGGCRITFTEDYAKAEDFSLPVRFVGDLNGNGYFGDAGDLVLVMRASVGDISLGDDEKYADANNNGIAGDAGDVLIVLRWSVWDYKYGIAYYDTEGNRKDLEQGKDFTGLECFW